MGDEQVKSSFDEFVQNNRLEPLLQPVAQKRKATIGRGSGDMPKKSGSIEDLSITGESNPVPGRRNFIDFAIPPFGVRTGSLPNISVPSVPSDSPFDDSFSDISLGNSEGEVADQVAVHPDAAVGEEQVVEQSAVAIGAEQVAGQSDVDVGAEQTAGRSAAPVILYSENHFGDFLILCDTSKATGKSDSLRNSLFFYESIRKFKFKGILLISHIGKTLFRIKFKTASDANNFVNFDLSSLGYRAFIPTSFVYSYGVIRGIPLGYSDEYIRENMLSSVPIVSVNRFYTKAAAKDTNNDSANAESPGARTPTYSVKVGFDSNEIPSSIVLNHTIVEVYMYYPPLRQCLKCGRLGHTERGCHSKKRCLKCGAVDDCSGQCLDRKCILCGAKGHLAKDRTKCPKWAFENDVLKVMTLKRISRKEVLKSYSPKTFETFDDYDQNFPPLATGRTGPDDRAIINRDEEVQKIVTKQGFNRVIKPKPKPKPRLNKPITQIQPVNTDPTVPVIYRKLEKVTHFEKLISELTGVMRDYFSKQKENSYIRVLDDYKSKLDYALLDMDREMISSSSPPILNSTQ